MSAPLLALRSVLWAILLPGMVTIILPWRFFGLRDARPDLRDPLHLLALVVIGVGAALLTTCILAFARSGRGTLSPADPPKTLVVAGLYRYVRNPMYLSVALVLIGEILLTRSRSLLIFALGWFTLVNVFVLAYEEPRLRTLFGASYEAYCRQVPRWLPRIPRRS